MTSDKSTPPGRGWKNRPERLRRPLRVRVRGRDAAGNLFKLTTVLDNIGEGGLYVCLDRAVEAGAALSFFVSFAPHSEEESSNAPRLCARGRVLRTEPQPDNLCGTAVVFTRHRFVKGRYEKGAV